MNIEGPSSKTSTDDSLEDDDYADDFEEPRVASVGIEEGFYMRQLETFSTNEESSTKKMQEVQEVATIEFGSNADLLEGSRKNVGEDNPAWKTKLSYPRLEEKKISTKIALDRMGLNLSLLHI